MACDEDHDIPFRMYNMQAVGCFGKRLLVGYLCEQAFALLLFDNDWL
ncbi:hypothetical protein MD588_07655 [Photobacterium sp. SDRW27]|nr:hypothetical protein [Photobacterium obscurum]MCW8328681.1 hypothetical protein [Photobacterium obscurum]